MGLLTTTPSTSTSGVSSRIIKEAKKQDADIVLFPECWITGYEFPSVDERLTVEEIMNTEQFKKWNELALQDDSKYIQEFCK